MIIKLYHISGEKSTPLAKIGPWIRILLKSLSHLAFFAVFVYNKGDNERAAKGGDTVDAQVKSRVFCVGDLVALLLVAALALSLLWAFFGAERGGYAEISVDGAVVATLPLAQDAVYPVESGGYSLTVWVEGGEVFVTDATCTDKVCQHTGRISANGASIVCAAARVSVRVTGGGKRDADYVAG